MMECLKCGDCCELITHSHDKKGLKGVLPANDWKFIEEHWHEVPMPLKTNNRFLNLPANRMVLKKMRAAGQLFYFKCDMWDSDTRLCKCHDTRPEICRKYPAATDLALMPLPIPCHVLASDRCGYMPESLRRRCG